MDGQWQQIEPPKGFIDAFQRGQFVATAKQDGVYYTFHLKRRLGDDLADLEEVGTWASLSESLNVPRLLGWADEQIAKVG